MAIVHPAGTVSRCDDIKTRGTGAFGKVKAGPLSQLNEILIQPGHHICNLGYTNTYYLLNNLLILVF